MKRKIRKRCKCGCGEITNSGRMYVQYHNRRGKKHTAEAKRKISETMQDRKQTAEHILNLSLANTKHDPNYPYCEVWHDEEYKKDIRKDYCENVDCKKISSFLVNHHIHLDKKRCKPIDIMTMCASCHSILHQKLQMGKKSAANPKDYIIINRPDHVSYVHKKSHKIIRINNLIRKEKCYAKKRWNRPSQRIHRTKRW